MQQLFSIVEKGIRSKTTSFFIKQYSVVVMWNNRGECGRRSEEDSTWAGIASDEEEQEDVSLTELRC